MRLIILVSTLVWVLEQAETHSETFTLALALSGEVVATSQDCEVCSTFSEGRLILSHDEQLRTLTALILKANRSASTSRSPSLVLRPATINCAVVNIVSVFQQLSQ